MSLKKRTSSGFGYGFSLSAAANRVYSQLKNSADQAKISKEELKNQLKARVDRLKGRINTLEQEIKDLDDEIVVGGLKQAGIVRVTLSGVSRFMQDVFVTPDDLKNIDQLTKKEFDDNVSDGGRIIMAALEGKLPGHIKRTDEIAIKLSKLISGKK